MLQPRVQHTSTDIYTQRKKINIYPLELIKVFGFFSHNFYFSYHVDIIGHMGKTVARHKYEREVRIFSQPTWSVQASCMR